jgi:plastocyanin
MTCVRLARVIVVTAAAAAVAAACGKSSSTGPSPNITCSSIPNPATTIWILNNAVCPASLTVPRGTRVTFINNDSRPHDMASNPHPEHTDCPAINDVGFLQAGQTRQTGNLTVARTCGFHDHDQPTNTALQGSIVTQ